MVEEVSSQNKMGTEKMFPLIATMAAPAMFSMLIQALYNIVDSYYVGLFSSDGLSALALAFPMQNLIVAFSVGTGVGAASLISRKLGEGDKLMANKVATIGVFLSAMTWLIFLVIGLTCSEAFYRLFEDNETIIALGVSYLTIVVSLSIFSFLQIYFERTLQATGNMFWAMVMQLVGAVVNIILDPIFIFGFGFIPAMGVAGAAIATVIGQFCGFLVALYLTFGKKSKTPLVYDFKAVKFEKNIIKSIYQVAGPSIAMNALTTISLTILYAILASFSTAAYTVYGIYIKLQSFIFLPLFGLSSGVMPVMAYNFGANNRKRFLSALKVALLLAVSLNTCGMLLFILFPSQLLMIFSVSDEMLQIGVVAFKILGCSFPMAAVAICFSTLFQATGNGLYSMSDTILRQVIILIPSAYFLSKIDLNLFWYALIISNTSSMIFSSCLFLRLYNKVIKFIPDGNL